MSPQMKVLVRKEWAAIARVRFGPSRLVLVGLLTGLLGALGIGLSMAVGIIAVLVASLIGADVPFGFLTMPARAVPYEFLFTQPVARRRVLGAKLLVAGGLVAAIFVPAAIVHAAVPGGVLSLVLRHLPDIDAPVARAGAALAAAVLTAVLGIAAGIYGGVTTAGKDVREVARARVIVPLLGPVMFAMGLTLIIDLPKLPSLGPKALPLPELAGTFAVLAAIVAVATPLYLRGAYRAIEERETPEGAS